MGLQDEITTLTELGVGKLNNMMIIGGTNGYLNSTITKRPKQVVLCYDDGGGLKKYRLFMWNDVDSRYEPLTLPPHYHTNANDGDKFLYLFTLNSNIVHFNDQSPLKERYNQTVSGTGASISNQNSTTNGQYVSINTGTTTTGYSRLRNGGVPLDYNDDIRLNIVWKLGNSTNQLFRFGIAVEGIDEVEDNFSKFGIEWCDAQINSNYYMLSASGSGRSLTDSTVAINTSKEGLRVNWLSGLNQIKYKFGVANLTIIKTSNTPSGGTNLNNQFTMGIKNNNGGAANRELRLHGLQYVADKGSIEWVE